MINNTKSKVLINRIQMMGKILIDLFRKVHKYDSSQPSFASCNPISRETSRPHGFEISGGG